MISRGEFDRRRRAPDEFPINLNIGTRWCRGNINEGHCGISEGLSRCYRLRLWSLKFRFVEPCVSVDVSCDLCTFRDRNVLSMHEKEKWCGRKEHNGGCHHPSGHCSRMTSAFGFLYGTKWDFFPITQSDRIDIDV